MEPLPAPPPPPPTPTGRKSALAFFGVLLALYLPGIVAQAAVLPLGLAWTELFVFLLPALVATAGSNLRAGPWLRLGAPASPSSIALGALAGAAGYVFAGSLVTLVQRLVPPEWLHAFDPSRLFEGPAWHAWTLAFVATVLAPVCEEIAFRGYVQTSLAQRHGPAAAVAGAAFLFALLHLNPVLFPALLVLGAVFGWLAWRGGSIWPAVAAHAVNNGITSTLVLTVEDRPLEPPPAAVFAQVMAVGGAALALILLAYAAATPRPAPAAGALVLRDPSDPSIRFSRARVPRPLAAAALAGAGLLVALLLAGAVAAARRAR